MMTTEEHEAFLAGRRAYDANRSLDEIPTSIYATLPTRDAWKAGWERGREIFRSHQASAREIMSRRPASRCEMSSRGRPDADDAPSGPGPC